MPIRDDRRFSDRVARRVVFSFQGEYKRGCSRRRSRGRAASAPQSPPSVAFRSALVKKWGLAPPPYAQNRENHAVPRCLSPFFHKLSAKERNFRGVKGDIEQVPEQSP